MSGSLASCLALQVELLANDVRVIARRYFLRRAIRVCGRLAPGSEALISQ
jgi:hypothetical protein